MRYASMRSMDISNGEGVGCSLFVQGCPFHCYNCFNQETWDFQGGNKWDIESYKRFMELAEREYITRISLLGGEPLADKNLVQSGIVELIETIRKNPLTSHKKIWLYTGYIFEDIVYEYEYGQENYNYVYDYDRYKAVSMCDVLVDGQFMYEQRDLSLKFRGSRNQRVIDVKKSIKEDKVVLYCD